jgi:hypothetical protein
MKLAFMNIVILEEYIGSLDFQENIIKLEQMYEEIK